MLRTERECTTATHWTEQQYRELFNATKSRPQRLALVAESELSHSQTESSCYPTPLGFLVARSIAPEWELENIIVATSARRQGVGKQLLEGLISVARATRSASVFLEVRERNMAARALYERLCFRETGRRKSYYANPLEDAILYSFNLNPARD
jgi:ribosomal-protein-alanine N-acetyltransferase